MPPIYGRRTFKFTIEMAVYDIFCMQNPRSQQGLLLFNFLSLSLPIYIYFCLSRLYIPLRCGWVSLINWRESGWILINHNLKWFCNSVVHISHFDQDVITVGVNSVGDGSGMLEWNYCCFSFKSMTLCPTLIFTKGSEICICVVIYSCVGPSVSCIMQLLNI
jgi:hypothetical protein